MPEHTTGGSKPPVNEGFHTRQAIKWISLITAFFFFLYFVVYALGAIPPVPTFADDELYETATWPALEATQRANLQNFSSYEASIEEEVETVNAQGTTVSTTVTAVVTRYTIPIDNAKDLVLDQGIPDFPATVVGPSERVTPTVAPTPTATTTP